MANHSCDPNCEVVVVRGGRVDEPDVTLALRALRDLSPGEEATISYLAASTTRPVAATSDAPAGTTAAAAAGTPAMLDRWKRLWETKFFLCECSRCIEEGSVAVNASAAVALGGDRSPPATEGSLSFVRPFSAAWYEVFPRASMRLACKELRLKSGCPADDVRILQLASGRVVTARRLNDLAMSLHLRIGDDGPGIAVDDSAIDIVSTKMQVWSHVYEQELTALAEAKVEADAEAVAEAETTLEPEPEPEPEPESEVLKSGPMAPLLVGHIVGVMTPEHHRHRGHATLALRECIAQLRLRDYDLVTVKSHRTPSSLCSTLVDRDPELILPRLCDVGPANRIVLMS
jgi:hypothetical protein